MSGPRSFANVFTQEVKSVPSEPYQVAFENEHVRIVHVSLREGQMVPRYAPAATTIVRIDLRPDGRGAVHGATTFSDGHLPEESDRPSETGVQEIRVELKAPPEAVLMALDAIQIDPARYKVELENDRVRVVRLRFEAGEKGMMVTHPPRVLATITDVSVRLLFADGRTDQRGAPAGVAAWLDAETLQTENAATKPLEVILVEPKAAQGFQSGK